MARKQDIRSKLDPAYGEARSYMSLEVLMTNNRQCSISSRQTSSSSKKQRSSARISGMTWFSSLAGIATLVCQSTRRVHRFQKMSLDPFIDTSRLFWRCDIHAEFNLHPYSRRRRNHRHTMFAKQLNAILRFAHRAANWRIPNNLSVSAI